MANIKKRDNGSYRARVYVGKDMEGKPIYRSLTRPGLREIKKAVRELEMQIEEGKLENIGNVRLVSWVEQFLQLHKDTYSPGTLSLYRGYLKTHFKPFFGNVQLRQVNELHIKKFRAHLLEKELQPSTVRRIMSALKRMLGECLKDKAPTNGVQLPKANKPKSKAPSRAEFQKIWDAAKGTEMEMKILLAGWCGLRRGEVLALKPNDFDFELGTVRVDESLALADKEVFLKTPKSDNSYRVEAVPKYLLELIEGHIKRRGKKSKVVPIKPAGNDWRLFGGRPDSLTTNFTRFIERHKLPKYTFHDLRHYHATFLWDTGIPDLYAAKRLGHSVDTLKAVYQHLGLERQKEIDDKILREIENPLN